VRKALCLALLLALLLPAVAGAVTITWTANTEPDVAGYRVYRNGAQVAQVADPKAVSWSNSTIAKACADVWQLSAYDACGNESELSDPGKWLPPGKPGRPACSAR
jgi:hypothetical protein